MEINKVNIRKWSMLGQRGTIFGEAALEIAKNNENFKVLTADLALLSGMTKYEATYPNQFLNCGIAEQNMVGIAAGLAMAGDLVFATTYASFIMVRSLEHARQHLSHMRCNVKLIGSAAGVVAAKSGISHWATEDLAFARVLPNIEVYSPADALEAYKVALYAATNQKPMYIRLSGGTNCPIVYKEDYEFVPGKLVQLVNGKNVAIIATGLMVNEAVKAAKILDEDGIECAVFNMHTIKPLDKQGLDVIFNDYEIIVTIEEHNVLGGMGSAIAEYKATKVKSLRQVFIGFQDTFTEAGSQRYVWEQAGITDIQIADRIRKELNCD